MMRIMAIKVTMVIIKIDRISFFSEIRCMKYAATSDALIEAINKATVTAITGVR